MLKSYDQHRINLVAREHVKMLKGLPSDERKQLQRTYALSRPASKKRSVRDSDKSDFVNLLIPKLAATVHTKTLSLKTSMRFQRQCLRISLVKKRWNDVLAKIGNKDIDKCNRRVRAVHDLLAHCRTEIKQLDFPIPRTPTVPKSGDASNDSAGDRSPAKAGFVKREQAAHKYKLMYTCPYCDTKQSAYCKKCSGCDKDVDASDVIYRASKLQLHKEWRQEQREQSKSQSGERKKVGKGTPIYNSMAKAWRSWYGMITHQVMDGADGQWKSIYENTIHNRNQRANPEKYTINHYTGFVDLLKRGAADDTLDVNSQDRKMINEVMHKFRDKNGVVNYHVTYQAAWFMDWVCQYMPIDISGQCVDKDGYRKKVTESKYDYKWYKCFRSKPPGPFRDEYFAYAWENFWIPAWWYNNRNVQMTTADHERSIKIDQQEVVDDLWTKFLTDGHYPDEKGYNLDKIPEKLHANWGQSCLAVHEPSVDSRAVGRPTADTQPTANTGIQFMAQPVSPPEPGYRERSSSTTSFASGPPMRLVQQLPTAGQRLTTQSKSRSPAPPWGRQPRSSNPSSSSHLPWITDNRN